MRQVDSQEGHVKNKVRLPAAVHTQGLGYVRTLSQCEENMYFKTMAWSHSKQHIV